MMLFDKYRDKDSQELFRLPNLVMILAYYYEIKVSQFLQIANLSSNDSNPLKVDKVLPH